MTTLQGEEMFLEEMSGIRSKNLMLGWVGSGAKEESQQSGRVVACESQQSINGGDRTLDLERVKLAS